MACCLLWWCCRPGLWYDPIQTQPTPPGMSCTISNAGPNGRRLQSAAHSGVEMLMAGSKAQLQPQAGGRKRGLLQGFYDYMPLPPWNWANGTQHEITPDWSSVTSLCYDDKDELNRDQLPGYNRQVRTGYGCWGFGQMMYDSGVCSQKGKSWVGAATVDGFPFCCLLEAVLAQCSAVVLRHLLVFRPGLQRGANACMIWWCQGLFSKPRVW